MHYDTARTELIVSRFLRRLMTAVGAAASQDALLAELLEALRVGLRGVAGVALLSTRTRSRPELPVLSGGWDEEALHVEETLRMLARYIRAVGHVKYYRQADQYPDALARLDAAMPSVAPCAFAVVPLCGYVPEGLADAAAYDAALVVALAGPEAEADLRAEAEPQRTNLEYVGWIIANLRMNREAARFAHQHAKLAATISRGALQILARTPTVLDGQARFGELVASIRELMGCDTCQLYLYPDHAPALHDKDLSRIWLVAESVAPREGLRYMRSERALLPYVWRNQLTTPLVIPDLLHDPEFARFALDKLGLTRHYLGALLTSLNPYEVLGVLELRDRFTADDPAAHPTATEGFTVTDQGLLEARAGKLRRLLGQPRVQLDRAQLQHEVDALRAALHAETAALFLTPQVLGETCPDERAFMTLYYFSRQNWLGRANYAPGERLTGRVLRGETINEPDLYFTLKEQGAGARGRPTTRPGKYRLSQHLLAVPVPMPGGEAAGTAGCAAIGVLKVRDRLDRDKLALSAQGFSHEEEQLLQALACMISAKLAMRETLLDRDAQERMHTAGLAESIRHDVAQILRPAFGQAGLWPKELGHLPHMFELASRMLDRSWQAAKILEGTYAPKANETCELREVLDGLFPGAARHLAPHPGAGHDVLVALRAKPEKDIPVRCDRTLLETALLVLPVWLYYHAGVTGVDDTTPRLNLELAVEPGESSVRLEFVVPRAVQWPTEPDQDEARKAQRPLSYTNRLVCTLIPVDVLQRSFATYQGKITYRRAADQTVVAIELEPVAAAAAAGTPPAEPVRRAAT